MFKFKNVFKSILPKGGVKFFLFILVTIVVTYRTPREIASLWYVVTLVLYFNSKDEAFWLAFYLVTVDGFMGFFGIYSVTIQLIPGLPAIELVQFYIVLSMIKALRSKNRPYVFYQKYLAVLLLYLIFMVAWGQLMGLSGGLNVYFRVMKLTLPMLLFYSVPRLFSESTSYRRIFSFVFIILILAFITQVFTLITGLSPAGFVHLTEEQLMEAGVFRGFSSVMSSLLGLFGALVYLSYKEPVFNRFYLYVVIACAFGNAYLSAGRGWIVFFSLAIFLSFIFAYKFSPKRLFGFGAVFAAFFILGLDNPTIRKQSDFTMKRLTTLEVLAAGDITAGGTLARLDKRSPRVLKKWAENPVFGWGFSDVLFDFGDGHVGNQNILLFSGVVGFMLLIGFLLFFCYKLFARYL
ncbi:MAG: hypothetical protein KKE86_17125, partial [Planctomycetes bacterium]|nr:hypothetical protein [Planctomycetota bacterium]